MPEDTETMQAHETRISLLEQQGSDVRATLRELTTDMRQLVAVVTQQAEDRAALKRAFGQLARVAEKVDALEAAMQADKEEALRKEADRAQAELRQVKADRRRLAWMVLGYSLAGAAGAVFAHFGIPMVTQ
jgi:chromosome segregation ATPase